MSLFKPEKTLPKYIQLGIGTPLQTRTFQTIEQAKPTNAFVRQITDALEITKKLVKQKEMIEKIVEENLLTEYDQDNDIVKQGLLIKQNKEWIARRTIPNIAVPLVKDFLYAYEAVDRIANYVQDRYDFNVKKGVNLHDAFVKAVLDAKLQFKKELDDINKKLL